MYWRDNSQIQFDDDIIRKMARNGLTFGDNVVSLPHLDNSMINIHRYKFNRKLNLFGKALTSTQNFRKFEYFVGKSFADIIMTQPKLSCINNKSLERYSLRIKTQFRNNLNQGICRGCLSKKYKQSQKKLKIRLNHSSISLQQLKIQKQVQAINKPLYPTLSKYAKKYNNESKIHIKQRNKSAQIELGKSQTQKTLQVIPQINQIKRKKNQLPSMNPSFSQQRVQSSLNARPRIQISKKIEITSKTQSQQRVQIKSSLSHSKFLQFSGEGDLTAFQLRLQKLFDFIFKINYSYGLLFDPALHPQSFKFKFTAFIGPGNNSVLIKNALKKRHWWKISQTKQNVNFLWTQTRQLCYIKSQPQSSCNMIKREQQNPLKQISAQFKSNHQHLFSNEDINDFHLIQKRLKSKKINFSLRAKLTGKPLQKIQFHQIQQRKLHNHLQRNFILGNKKWLLFSLTRYYSLNGIDQNNKIPLTYHIKFYQDSQYKQLQKKYIQYSTSSKSKNIWIVKPGQNSNRGSGILVIQNLAALKAILNLKQKHKKGTLKTYVVQQYIDRPLLYQKRKFDLRHYMLITYLHGVMRAYWYKDGYVRTSSFQYSTNALDDPLVHLTNDAIQKHSSCYGKFQNANKLSYNELNKYIQSVTEKQVNFYSHILPKMMQLAKDSVKATAQRLNPRRIQFGFQLLGLDFMIDQEMNPLLIEVNTNPCLQTPCALLSAIIPGLIQNTFRLVVDPLFPPFLNYQNTQQHNLPDGILHSIKYQKIFQFFSQLKSDQTKLNQQALKLWQIQQDMLQQNEKEESLECQNQQAEIW